MGFIWLGIQYYSISTGNVQEFRVGGIQTYIYEVVDGRLIYEEAGVYFVWCISEGGIFHISN